MSVFDDYRAKIYKDQHAASLVVGELHGGVPMNPDVARKWLEVRMGGSDEHLANLQAQVVAELGLDEDLTDDELLDEMTRRNNLNGFKRLDSGELYIEGRQVKAMLKEAASIAVAGEHLNSRGWGKTNKGLLGFLAEHIFVLENRIGLGVHEPSGIHQRFVSTWRGTGIQLEEYVSDAKVACTVATDYDFPKNFWPTIWTIAESNGLGAARSMGFGTFEVVGWDQLCFIVIRVGGSPPTIDSGNSG
jgi:hypothetical protein